MATLEEKTMTQSKLKQWRKVLRSRVYITLFVAIIALTVALAMMASAAETDSAPEDAMLENKPWTGDFDKMAEDRVIRVLVAFSKTFYFLDRGRQRGLSYDLLKEFD